MLIAMALTLVIMGAVVSVFDMLGTGVTQSRSMLEMSDRVRQTRDLLQTDLASLTCPTLPWRRPEEGVGYFELVEGQYNDGYKAPGSTAGAPFDGTQVNTPGSGLGDWDDILAFTVRSRGEPFVGQYNGVTVRSHVAEIIWFAVEDLTTRRRTIYRRVFLVAPWLASITGSSPTYYDGNDVSVRFSSGNAIPNTLGDLTKRENRTWHNSVTFPYAFSNGVPLVGTRQGEDVVLSNVLAFDVRVFDPTAPIRRNFPSMVIFGPLDPAWGVPIVQGVVDGAYVDLGYRNEVFPGTTSLFSSTGHPKSQLPLTPLTYDTWSFHYENDGENQDGDRLIDEGTDGFDDSGESSPYNDLVDSVNGVDDIGERETSPPYPSALRGIKVVIRVYEPDSRQIRQVSVIQNFVSN